jgi:hypothetical protein
VHNLQNQINEARNRVVELNASFVKEMEMNFAQKEESVKRRTEDSDSSQELLKSMNIDLSKIDEYNHSETKKAQSTLESVKSKLKFAPKNILSQAQDKMLMDEILNGGGIYNPLERKFFITNAIASQDKEYLYTSPGGIPAQGNCGNITYGVGSTNQMAPWCLATGAGPYCYSEISVVCSLWFLIPREYIPAAGTLIVSPYFDIHGFFWDRANMVLGTTKEAAIAMRMQTHLYHASGPGPVSSTFWTALNYDGHNIDQSGRFDYTGYNSSATGKMQVPADEPAFVQVIAELDGYAQGAGSMGMLNFNGEGNAVKIPNLMCVLDIQPVSHL